MYFNGKKTRYVDLTPEEKKQYNHELYLKRKAETATVKRPRGRPRKSVSAVSEKVNGYGNDYFRIAYHKRMAKKTPEEREAFLAARRLKYKLSRKHLKARCAVSVN